MPKRKLFCEYNRLFYKIAVIKENLRRTWRNNTNRTPFAARRSTGLLPNVWCGHRSYALRPLPGVDMGYQQNKVKNLRLALATITGLTVYPGEVFSFWECVGKPTKQKGYLPGLVLRSGQIGADIGGGICQLANLIHWLVLNSPLMVAEIHHHTDAIFPDVERRVPFGTGTSVFYKNVDYRFLNQTDHPVQLLLWMEDDFLCGELRSAVPARHHYRLVEEDHHFAMDIGKMYRNSKVYRLTFCKHTGAQTRELLLENHSEVLYDYSLIPAAQIRGA